MQDFFLNIVWLVLLLPLLASVINGLFGRRLGARAGWIATGLVFLAFLIAVGIFIDVLNRPGGAPFEYDLYTWIPSGDFKVDIAFLVDPLTAVMLMVVLGVGSVVHLYSNGYMADDVRADSGVARFFSYLPFFIFSMLILVLSNNLLLLFVGWEAVG
ncbi:MAG: NADH-quinone oxidoreductase subunit L, partial [Chloroflexota bacterium]